jgi:hypothetical protein
VSRRARDFHLRHGSAHAGNPPPLCAGCGYPSAWLPDGKAVLVSTGGQIQRIDLSTGAATTVLSKQGLLLDEAECSPDEQWIAFSARAPGQERIIYVAPYGQAGGWRQVDPRKGWSDKPHWSSNGKSLYFYSNADGYRCIWSRAFQPRHRSSGRAAPADTAFAQLPAVVDERLTAGKDFRRNFQSYLSQSRRKLGLHLDELAASQINMWGRLAACAAVEYHRHQVRARLFSVAHHK